MPTTLTATYRAYAIFTIPEKYRHLPKERFSVFRCELYIETESGKVVKIQPRYDPEDSIDWKRGSQIEFDVDDPASEDDEEVVESESEEETEQ